MARPHTKTRTGCVQCKHRKIKCDEAIPSCRNCIRHRSTCSFLQYVPLGRGFQHGRIPSRESSHHRPPVPPHSQDKKQDQQQPGSSNAYSKSPRNTKHNTRAPIPALRSWSRPSPTPKPTLNSLPTTFTGPDLHLLHTYTTQTSQSMLGPHMTGSSIWGTSLVSLSFTQPFLIHAMFSLSALHLVHLHSSSPDQLLSQKFQQVAMFHHTKTLALFRHELQNLNEENAAAAAACSSFLSLILWLVRGGKGKNIFFPSALPSSAPSSLSLHIQPPSSTSLETEPLDESRTIAPWYKLHRGGHQTVTMTYTWILHSPNSDLVDIVRPWIVVETDVALRVAKINLSPLPRAQPSGSTERSSNVPAIPGHLPALQPSSASTSPSSSQNPIWILGQSEPANPDELINRKREEALPETDEDRLLRLAACWAPPFTTTTTPTHHLTLSATDISALDETLVTLRYVFSIVSPPHPPSTPVGSSPSPPPPTRSVSPPIAALSWPTIIPPHFCNMVEARVPEALVLLAVYCVALKRTGGDGDGDGHGGLWWIEGKGESLLGAVGREMGKLSRRGGEGDMRGEKEGESWEKGGWEEWVREEMGMEFR